LKDYELMTIVHHMEDDDDDVWLLEGITLEMKWNAQGKCMTCRTFHFIGHWIVNKCMARFMINSRTIKRGILVCMLVI